MVIENLELRNVDDLVGDEGPLFLFRRKSTRYKCGRPQNYNRPLETDNAFKKTGVRL